MVKNRRDFLKMSGLGLGVATGFASNLASFNAFGADTTDYKALVCVFLRGGMDSNDLIIPYDRASSIAYESIRAPLLDQYAAEGFASRRKSRLLRLQGIDGDVKSAAGPADGREFAFPEEMRELRDLYREMKVAIVGNVGPLVEPTSAAGYNAANAKLPARLFSHNDQESMWMASNPQAAASGWGGRFGDIMQAAKENRFSSFTSVSTSGNRVFANGITSGGFILSDNGVEQIQEMKSNNSFGKKLSNAKYNAHSKHDNISPRKLQNTSNSNVYDNLYLQEVFAKSADVVTAFPSSSLGVQLATVAKMISNRSMLGMRRQIFIVTDNGYDSHSLQARRLPAKQAIVAKAMAAFYKEMKAQGIENNVTQFTASDFGRTLVPNANGTDHGWGSHHLVLGGAVNGGKFYGEIPEAALNHSQDAGRGRLIPQVSVDEYAYSLGRWFGLRPTEAIDALPNVNNFNRRSLRNMLPWS